MNFLKVNTEHKRFHSINRQFLIVGIGLFVIQMVSKRWTVVCLLILLGLLYLLLPHHKSRLALISTSILLLLAIWIPIDIYVSGIHGTITGRGNTGLRLVRVVWGKPKVQQCIDKYGEFITAGCRVGLHPTRWMLVFSNNETQQGPGHGPDSELMSKTIENKGSETKAEPVLGAGESVRGSH